MKRESVQEPLQTDLVLSFPEHGFHLRFDSRSQVCSSSFRRFRSPLLVSNFYLCEDLLLSFMFTFLALLSLFLRPTSNSPLGQC